ncbi:hypothetical protein RBA41_13785 [Massilia sp. CCM 9210]|uniref:hypothetical protein n=1 Tax=Massilia scottii TaxID=3057166 RepID=UPI00279667FE|nr:hypothetical protein [Massilia sp. CCM 9210]MDQ1814379.1 hypothetical protein [Massilia sp. CCM 9210]
MSTIIEPSMRNFRRHTRSLLTKTRLLSVWYNRHDCDAIRIRISLLNWIVDGGDRSPPCLIEPVWRTRLLFQAGRVM